MSLDLSTCLKFYKRKEIQDALIEQAAYKEIGVRYAEGFGKRPDILSYHRDVLELALKGVTSFHSSEELWHNPLQLSSELKRSDLDELRRGWDLVLDIDCALFEYSRICAELIVQFLHHCEVKDFFLKFSGNKGFHIGIPFEAFPEKVGDKHIKDLFPEAPRRLAFYVKENIKDALGRRILAYEKGSFAAVCSKVNLPADDIVRFEANEFGDMVAKLNVDLFLEIDTVLLASRHLYRMAYSLHEKSGLVSIPVEPANVSLFERLMAKPENITAPLLPFMTRNVSAASARRLIQQAFDFNVKIEEPKLKKEITADDSFAMELTSPISEEFFPPCLKAIFAGIEDGKKRAIFIASNYLGKIGWTKARIEEYLEKWNKEKNKDPLRDVYLRGQMIHFKSSERLPPNCNNDAYYKSIGVCHPDGLCRKIKNPVNYTLIRWRQHLEYKAEEDELAAKEAKKKANLLKAEQREARKREKVLKAEEINNANGLQKKAQIHKKEELNKIEELNKNEWVTKKEE